MLYVEAQKFHYAAKIDVNILEAEHDCIKIKNPDGFGVDAVTFSKT